MMDLSCSPRARPVRRYLGTSTVRCGLLVRVKLVHEPREDALRPMRLLALLVALLLVFVVSGETTIELNGSNAYVDIADLVRR